MQRGVTMNEIKALIVVYNQTLCESKTFNSIKDIPGIDVIIADNSTKDFGNQIIAQQSGCTYISMNGNEGLSKTYNKVLSTLDKRSGLICLFDDDAQVGQNYFDALNKAARKHSDINIFAPIVKDRVGILSPCIISGISVSRTKDVESIPQDAISVINSGLAIRLKVFEDYQYDEGQFLDYVDHAFIKDIVNHDKRKVYIMDNVEIVQRFSGSEKSSRIADKARYTIFKKDVGYFCEKYGISHFSRMIVLLKRRVSLFIKYL